MTVVAEPSGITIRVESFEGPLDLLLHLCRTDEMDLTRVPVRTITDQYLTHLESVRFQDLETAGAFMVMAATLIYLKSKLLLPASPDDPAEALDEEGELLRQELAERLREYARVKALGAWLGEREAEQALLFGRLSSELPPPEDIPLEDLSVHLLQRALQRLIEEQKRQRPREVEPNPLSVLERMGEILDLLRNTWSILFSSVAGQEKIRAEWVVTLLALLELVRLGQARARQAELFGEITIERHSVSVREPRPPRSTTRPRAGTRSGAMTEPLDVLEALLFASDAPVEAALIQEVLELPSADAARELVEALRRRFDEQGRVLQIIEVGGGFRLVTRPEVAPWLVKLARSKTQEPAVAARARDARHHRLSPARVASRGGCRARRQLRGRARQPARAPADPHRRAQGLAGPAVPLRDHARVPRGLRPARPRRPAEGGGRAHRGRSRRRRRDRRRRWRRGRRRTCRWG